VVDPGDPAILTGKVTKTGDWGGDYCMTIDVTNSGGTATAWRAKINTNGSRIYNTWNATYNGVSGEVTATPNQSFNIVIDPGETDTSMGFCAHRWAPGQTAQFVSVEAL
jgi:cellulase/cellobiase CelA1